MVWFRKDRRVEVSILSIQRGAAASFLLAVCSHYPEFGVNYSLALLK